MADGITATRAVRSRGLHDIGLGFDSIFASIAEFTEPYRWQNRHIDIGESMHGRNGVASFAGPDTYGRRQRYRSTMPASLEREDDPEFCGYGVTTSPDANNMEPFNSRPTHEVASPILVQLQPDCRTSLLE